MSDQNPHPAAQVITEIHGISEAVRSLVIAIDEVDDAERELDRRVRAEFGVNTTDLATLQYIDRISRRGRPALARDIARRFDMSSGSATEVVHRLERAGLLRKISNPDDGRSRVLVLTDAATSRLEHLVGEVRSNLNDLLLSISDHEEARLIELLNAVRDIFRTIQTQDPPDAPPR